MRSTEPHQKRRRSDRRAGNALHRARGDQCVCRRRERRGDRRQAEGRRADEVELTPADTIAKCAHGNEQPGEPDPFAASGLLRGDRCIARGERFGDGGHDCELECLERTVHLVARFVGV